MKNNLLKKGLIFGIIILLIGTNVFPANTINEIKSNDSMQYKFINDDYTNYLGTIYFNFSRFSVDVGFKHPKNTDYIFPVKSGNYTLNFTVELNITSQQQLFLARGALTYAKISTDDLPIWMAVGINAIRGEMIKAWTIKDVERDYYEPPINGMENVTLSIILQGRGFPFGFLKPEKTSFTITAHFVER